MFASAAAAWSAKHQLISRIFAATAGARACPGRTRSSSSPPTWRTCWTGWRPRADVLGYSQGGTVAQQLARDRPERVEGLVLTSTYAYNLLDTWLFRAGGNGRTWG